MHTVKIRIIGDEARAETLLNMLHGMDGVEHVEEIPLFDGRPHADGSSDAQQGATHAICNIEVAVIDDSAARRIRMFTAGAAILMDTSAEFIDGFQMRKF